MELDPFQKFPKIPRMDGNTYITEKLDGTNACIVVAPGRLSDSFAKPVLLDAGGGYAMVHSVYAQSRNRIITPSDDNYGFAEFVWDNAETLALGLEQGRHYGEWWGRGINRSYNMSERWFSLFNTGRWSDGAIAASCMTGLPVAAVPVVRVHGSLDTSVVDAAMGDLQVRGSYAAPGFKNPEGVVVYHAKSGHYYKRTFDGDVSKYVHAAQASEWERQYGGAVAVAA